MTILDAMSDPALFGRWFEGPTWTAWRAFLAALFGLAMSEVEAAIYARCTGRTTLPDLAAREAWMIIGRRGGKSRIAALVAIYLACFIDHRSKLAPGEVGTVAIIAADRRQARTLMRYIRGFFEAVPMLAQLVAAQKRESIELMSGLVIEVHTASFRSVRGYTLVAVIADEVAFWNADEGAANPDVEIINGLRPGLATTGGLLLGLSSPYARRGVLWDAYRRHHGRNGDPVLCWQASTAVMNPTVDAAVIARAYEEDEAAAAAEYGAQFRRDIEAFISREAVEACVVPGRIELPRVGGVAYRAFVDPSGGSQDAMTLAIAHREKNGRRVLDVVRERRPPFSPEDVVVEFAAELKRYGITTVTGDRYSGDWVAERFRKHGVRYAASEKTRSELYRDLLPMVNSGQLELLDSKRLVAQLISLERRTARGGRDSIDHAPGGHDDLANAAAGAVVGVRERKMLFAC